MHSRTCLFRSFCLIPALLALVLPVSAQEQWSRFRGPNGSGSLQTGELPAKLDDSTTLWKLEIGKGWSSPVVWGEKVFLTMEADAGRRAIACLDVKTGQQLWRYEVPYTEHRQHKFNSFASSTPCVDVERVYVNWANGDSVEALALDHNGNLLWRRTDVSPFVHEHGSGSSAVVADGVMLVRCEFEGPDNTIQGLDAETGKTLWKLAQETGKNTYSTPVIHQTATGNEFVIANTKSGFIGIDVRTGKVNWQHNPGYTQRSVGSFAFNGQRLFGTLGSGGGGKESAVLDINSGNPSEPYQLKSGIPYVPTPLVKDGLIYLLGDGGIIKCVRFEDGQEIYTERLSGASGKSTKYFSSPVLADGKVYCCSQTGDVVIFKEGEEFEVLSANQLDGPMNATPALTSASIIIRTDHSLYCFGIKKNPVP